MAPTAYDGQYENKAIATDLKRTLRETGSQNENTFRLTADVSEVHMQVPRHLRDWHLFVCQLQPDAEVYVNTFGTFGAASTSNDLSHVASAIGRLSQYLAGNSVRTWQMTTTWKREDPSVDTHFVFSSSLVPRLVFLWHGRQRRTMTRWSGSGSNSCTNPTTRHLTAPQCG